jgi:hypothetical protein
MQQSENSDAASVKLVSRESVEYRIPVKYATSLMVIREFISLSPEMTNDNTDILTADCFRLDMKSLLERVISSLDSVLGSHAGEVSKERKSAGHDAASALLLVLERLVHDEGTEWSINYIEQPTFQINFPRVWELLRFAMGARARELYFEPAYNDLLADHLESQLPRYQTTWTRRWIQACFFARTAGLIAQCMAVGLRGAIGAMVVPMALREAVLKWWYGG